MNPATASADQNPGERRALARFAAVQAVLQARQRGLSLARALIEASQQAWDGRFYSPETLGGRGSDMGSGLSSNGRASSGGAGPSRSEERRGGGECRGGLTGLAAQNRKFSAVTGLGANA